MFIVSSDRHYAPTVIYNTAFLSRKLLGPSSSVTYYDDGMIRFWCLFMLADVLNLWLPNYHYVLLLVLMAPSFVDTPVLRSTETTLPHIFFINEIFESMFSRHRKYRLRLRIINLPSQIVHIFTSSQTRKIWQNILSFFSSPDARSQS